MLPPHDSTGTGGPLRLDDEHAPRTYQDVIDVAVPAEVEAVDEPPTLVPLHPVRYCFRRRFLSELPESPTVGTRQGIDDPGQAGENRRRYESK